MIELPPIRRVLAANRGLPAIEIVEAVQGMGLEAAIAAAPSDTRSAAYAKADARTGLPVSASHVERDSYTNIQWMLEAAERVNADAIHPGYGFLSEEPEFARQVELIGKHFIGPKEHALRVFGSKTRFRQHARESNVPVIPASRQYVFTGDSEEKGRLRSGIGRGVGKLSSLASKGNIANRLPNPLGRLENDRVRLARAFAEVIGERVWPASLDAVVDDAVEFVRAHGDIVVKSPYGGGGMGTVLLRGIGSILATNENEARTRLRSAILAANRVSMRANRQGVFFEKLIDRAGHIEMQVIADRYGNVHVMGFERDCSWQFGERKMVEQSPSYKLSTADRESLHLYARRIIQEIDSPGIFTVEFLKEMTHGDLYALEVNPRLQVEHKVTELVTWVEPDQTLRLIPIQVRIASGDRYESFPHESKGHAVEARILVNVDERDGGHLTDVQMPAGEGLHITTNFSAGYHVPGGYDGHVAKIIAVGDDSAQANKRLLNALKQTRLCGEANNLDFLIANLEREEFLDGSYTTGFISGATLTDVFQYQA